MDVADILGVDRLSSRKASAAANTATSAPKRPEGISREVLNLLGPDVELPISILPTTKVTAAYKERAGKRKSKKWIWAQIYNSARGGMHPSVANDTSETIRKQRELSHPTLFHWQREDAALDYPFSRFNRPSIVLQYTSEQYEKANKVLTEAAKTAVKADPSSAKGAEAAKAAAATKVTATKTSAKESTKDADKMLSAKAPKPVSSPWTKEETDRLFALCSKFGLVWPAVFDRWKAASGTKRSMQDLKARFFAMSRQVLNQCSDSFAAGAVSPTQTSPTATNMTAVSAQSSDKNRGQATLPIIGIPERMGTSGTIWLKKKARAMFEALKSYDYDLAAEEARCARNERLFNRTEDEERERLSCSQS